MSDKKITQLNVATTLDSDDVMVIVNEDQTRKTTLDTVKTFIHEDLVGTLEEGDVPYFNGTELVASGIIVDPDEGTIDIGTGAPAEQIISVGTTGDTINMIGEVILAADATDALGAVTLQQLQAWQTGLWDDRGTFTPSGNYPSSGGSGTGGAILKGDTWTISGLGAGVSASVGAKTVNDGDVVRALINTPGNTDANWAIQESNLGYTPITNVLNSGNILVGNGSNVAASVAMSGDVTISNAGVTAIGSGKVTGTMLASMTSAEVAGAVSDETGYTSGALLVFSKSPTVDAPTISGHPTIEGETLTGVTGTGKLVLDNAPTIAGHPTIEGQTLTGVTGTGKLVLDASPALTGNPTAPTQSAGDNSTKVATTSYVDTGLALKEATANKNAANGYAGLDSNARVPIARMLIGLNYILDRQYVNTAVGSTTAETVVATSHIPSGTVSSGDNFSFSFWLETNSNANAKTWRAYFNTSADLSGSPVLIGTCINTTNEQISSMSRTFWVLSDTTMYSGAIATADSASGNGAFSSDTKTIPSVSSGFYLVISAQKAATGDTMRIKGMIVGHQKFS